MSLQESKKSDLSNDRLVGLTSIPEKVVKQLRGGYDLQTPEGWEVDNEQEAHTYEAEIKLNQPDSHPQ